MDGLDFSAPISNMSNINVSGDVEHVTTHESYRETNETDLIVRRSESLRQASLINKKFNNKNMNTQSEKLNVNLTKWILYL